MRDRKHFIGVCILLISIGCMAIGALLINDLPGSAQGRILYYGSRGEEVREVQWRLSQWGYYQGAVDGIFGPQTYSAVRLFQQRNGLAVDGIVGRNTFNALGLPHRAPRPAAPAAPATPATGVSRNDDLDLLARIIHAEAQGEPYLGKVAVGAVVLNRISDPAFPNTMAGVIYQPLAFESVANARVYLAPAEESRRAARDALNGWDPTYGSLYFWNPYKPVTPWIWTRTIIRQIGDHVFGV